MIINGEKYYSVSQLNLWEDCHKSWWLQKRKEYINPELKDNKYLLRGTLVHEILENYYPEKDILKYFKQHKHYNKLDNEMKESLKDISILWKHNCKLPSKKIKKEYKIINHELRMVAYIDVIGDDFILDYKTSKYRGYVPKNYKFQLKIYALLYYLETGKMITRLGIYYLKYSQIKWIKVNKKDILKMKNYIINTQKEINEYTKNGDKTKCTYTGRWECSCDKLIKKEENKK